jgi:hypothetical protein
MPQKIVSVTRRSLDRYLEMESLLHNFFDRTGYCRENFGVKCNGCCNENVANYPKKYRGCRELDEERMRIYGAGNLTRGCPYSSDNGCVLATHKAPKCIAYICPQFTKALNEQGIDYDWFEVHTLLISILNEGKFDWWSGSKIESHYISDEEFFAIKSRFEELLNLWALKAAKKTEKILC